MLNDNEVGMSCHSTLASQVETELRRRAEVYLRQKHLIADGYRIRRRLAYPLPLRRLEIPEMPVPGIPDYPWSVWMSWALEERVNSLGWAAQWFDDEAARHATTVDLTALAQWPQYRQLDSLDLCLGHTARLLARSYRQWPWLPTETRAAMETALRRVVADSGPRVEAYLGGFSNAAAILAAPEPHAVLHNIRLIGALGVTLAANTIGAPEKAALNRDLQNALEALFALREDGFSEGVAYDGYALDFLLDWLPFLPAETQSTFIAHPQFARFFDESLQLGAPGDVAQVAELGDVEPREMPFHISAQAKSFAWQPLPERAWYLRHCRLDWLRADTLASLHAVAEDLQQKQREPATRAAHAHYAVVLRGGWQRDDVAVVVTASNSPMGHIHSNNGSLAIGTRGHWFIATPGYQQYIPNSEREFTLGVASRNTPALNGQSQVRKTVEISLLETHDKAQIAELDLTQCYPDELALQAVRRRVQLIENRLVIVEDTISGAVEKIDYYWHGHRDAAWWIEDKWARLHHKGSTLWLTSPQAEITDRGLQRLRGSRGQLTLVAQPQRSETASTRIQWFFLFSEVPPRENELFQRCILVAKKSARHSTSARFALNALPRSSTLKANLTC
jgi:hypothetical protein